MAGYERRSGSPNVRQDTHQPPGTTDGSMAVMITDVVLANKHQLDRYMARSPNAHGWTTFILTLLFVLALWLTWQLKKKLWR